MSRIQKNCLTASLALHGLLLAILLLAPAFSRRETPPPPTPVLEFLPADLKLTADGTVRGGTPPAAPPKVSPPAPQPAPSPAAKPPEPNKPEPAKPEPAKSEPAKPEAHKIAVAPEPVRSAAKPQDQDPTRKAEKKIETDPQAAANKGAKPGVKVSSTATKVTTTDADRQKHEAAEAERTRREAARIAKLLGQSTETLKKEFSSSTEITMPGPGGGGPVTADYFAYLKAFYQVQWNRRKPANVSVKLALVRAEITISRNGSVSTPTIVEASGIGAVDDSVRRVLNENKQLKPLPAEIKDSQITVPITFRVEGEPSA